MRKNLKEHPMDQSINDLIEVKNALSRAPQRQIRSRLSCEATLTHIERSREYIETYQARMKEQRARRKSS